MRSLTVLRFASGGVVAAVGLLAMVIGSSADIGDRTQRPRAVPSGSTHGPSPQVPDRVIAVVTGQARVIDGDTIDIDGTRIRLEGIDAPERAQICRRDPAPGLKVGSRQAERARWRAGDAATAALEATIAGRPVSCRVHTHDGYGRAIATCFAGGHNLNAGLIRRGMAWAFVKHSQTYAVAERDAQRRGVGLWASDCQRAWTFRAQRWMASAQAAPEGCPIKGNISRRGRLYHTPWSPWYNRTRISTARGERWFCSEAEARAAGWRPAHRS